MKFLSSSSTNSLSTQILTLGLPSVILTLAYIMLAASTLDGERSLVMLHKFSECVAMLEYALMSVALLFAGSTAAKFALE